MAGPIYQSFEKNAHRDEHTIRRSPVRTPSTAARRREGQAKIVLPDAPAAWLVQSIF